MATMRDVAARAHVSAKTVSRVFNDPHVSPETKQRVEQALRELNYVPNSIATTFRSGAHPPSASLFQRSPLFASIAEAAETLAAAHDMSGIGPPNHLRPSPPARCRPQLCGQARDACWHGAWIAFEGRPSPPEGVP